MKTYSINDFKAGEIVYLKSDTSQPMAISKVDVNNNSIRCYWRDKKKGQAVNETFPPEVLCKESDIPPRMAMRVQSI